MPRIVTVAAAQLGAIQKADTRQAVVARMLDLMDQAKAKGADFIVYPELALTTFFPRWYHEDRARGRFLVREGDAERRHAAAVRAGRQARHGHELRLRRADARTGITSTRRSWSTRRARSSASTARCICPATPSSTRSARTSTWRSATSSRATSAFPVWRFMGGIFGMCICNDRRWPEVYRVMGLQGVEMIALGFNTPSVNSQKSEEGPEKRIFHHKLSAAGRRLSELDLGGGRGQGRRRGRAIPCSAPASSSIPTARSSPRRAPRRTRWSCTLAISMPPASARRRSSISSAIAASSTMDAITSQVGVVLPPEA